MTYIGFALMIGGAAVLLLLRHDLRRGFGPRAAAARPKVPARPPGAAVGASAQPAATTTVGAVGATKATIRANRPAEEERPPVVHPRAEARRRLQAERAARVR
ncbi:MAG TPA: hypothetical protein VES42_24085, partial [Pilimelia sp.]|nr:hypothetical protein [Pilimelia sp.]